MTERAGTSIELRSNLGYALMFQVTSALFILGGTLFFDPIGLDLIWLVVTAGLYLIGFIQLLVTRYIMQREKNGILVAFLFATFAAIISFALAILWYLSLWNTIGMLYYIITGIINVALAILLRKLFS
jgi:hypothetical protein